MVFELDVCISNTRCDLNTQRVYKLRGQIWTAMEASSVQARHACSVRTVRYRDSDTFWDLGIAQARALPHCNTTVRHCSPYQCFSTKCYRRWSKDKSVAFLFGVMQTGKCTVHPRWQSHFFLERREEDNVLEGVFNLENGPPSGVKKWILFSLSVSTYRIIYFCRQCLQSAQRICATVVFTEPKLFSISRMPRGFFLGGGYTRFPMPKFSNKVHYKVNSVGRGSAVQIVERLKSSCWACKSILQGIKCNCSMW